MKSPKQPQPTAEETALRKRQAEDIARLDDEENRRIKGLVRGRLGAGSLLAGKRSSGSGKASGPTASNRGPVTNAAMANSLAGLNAAMRG